LNGGDGVIVNTWIRFRQAGLGLAWQPLTAADSRLATMPNTSALSH
jgi:hypothetical protein